MRRKYFLVLLSMLVLLVACGYEAPVMKRTVSPAQPARDSRYGQIYLETVQVYRPPKGVRTFPDGGTPAELKYELVYHQIDGPGVPDYFLDIIPAESPIKYYQVQGQKDNVVKVISLTKVDRRRFGDLIKVETQWVADNRMKYRAVWGFWKNEKETTGEIVLEPLQ